MIARASGREKPRPPSHSASKPLPGVLDPVSPIVTRTVGFPPSVACACTATRVPSAAARSTAAASACSASPSGRGAMGTRASASIEIGASSPRPLRAIACCTASVIAGPSGVSGPGGASTSSVQSRSCRTTSSRLAHARRARSRCARCAGDSAPARSSAAWAIDPDATFSGVRSSWRINSTMARSRDEAPIQAAYPNPGPRVFPQRAKALSVPAGMASS